MEKKQEEGREDRKKRKGEGPYSPVPVGFPLPRWGKDWGSKDWGLPQGGRPWGRGHPHLL